MLDRTRKFFKIYSRRRRRGGRRPRGFKSTRYLGQIDVGLRIEVVNTKVLNSLLRVGSGSRMAGATAGTKFQ
jgi:hypothetical protein